MNKISPKERFQKNNLRLKEHGALVASESFIAAIEAALLEMQFLQPNSNAANVPGAHLSQIKMEGAKEFISIFLNLSETQKQKPATLGKPNLDHNP